MTHGGVGRCAEAAPLQKMREFKKIYKNYDIKLKMIFECQN
jgi:hypothetical protein